MCRFFMLHMYKSSVFTVYHMIQQSVITILEHIFGQENIFPPVWSDTSKLLRADDTRR